MLAKARSFERMKNTAKVNITLGMTYRWLRAILVDLLIVPLLIFFVINNELCGYGLRQLKGQLNIVMNSRDIVDVLGDAQVPDSIKIKLRLIQEIREFAFDSLGLTRNENYTTFFDQQGQRLMYVVTASERYCLKPHLWHFPVIGAVGYKGFFREDLAKHEAERLKAQGYDVHVGGASGWSTLGWLKDPVLSQMLTLEEGDLAELIIHELLHGTIYIPDNTEWNENFATFVGEEGAKLFLKSKYGPSSKQELEYLSGKEADEERRRFMFGVSSWLRYQYNRECTSDTVMMEKNRQESYRSIERWAHQYFTGKDAAFASSLVRRINKSGNTVFLSSQRYESQQEQFRKDYNQSELTLRDYIARLVISHN
jgi:Putative aminopeptidase